MNYISERMATVGVGSIDTREAAAICDQFDHDTRDVLDCMDNLGINQRMLPKYQHIVDNLKDKYSDDDLIVLARYVATQRNLREY